MGLNMIYIVCDMNCNNFGNYFYPIGVERLLKSDKASWIVDKNTFYPKGHCYRAKLFGPDPVKIRYSQAIDFLLPEEYIKWMKIRFKPLAIR
jgi:hypothetical protein